MTPALKQPLIRGLAVGLNRPVIEQGFILLYGNLYAMIAVMSTINYTDLRRNLASAMDQVNEDHAPLYITRQKGKGAVLLSADDYAAIEETLYLMSSPRNAARLTEAIEGLRQGEVTERDLIE